MANKTLLQLVVDFSMRSGMQVPVAVAGSGDRQILQIFGLLNELIEELVNGYAWQQLTHTANWVSTGAASQGLLTTLAPNGFLSVKNGTFFDLTQRIEVFGPLSDNNWQARRALPATGPYYQYRILRGELLVNPAVPAAHNLSFEYKSTWGVVDAAGNRKPAFTADDDTCVFDDMLMLAGLRWKWRQEKRLDFESDEQRFRAMAVVAAGADGTKGPLRLDGANAQFRPGIYVPSGSWNLP